MPARLNVAVSMGGVVKSTLFPFFSTGDLLSGTITCVCMLHWSICRGSWVVVASALVDSSWVVVASVLTGVDFIPLKFLRITE